MENIFNRLNLNASFETKLFKKYCSVIRIYINSFSKNLEPKPNT